MVGHCGIVGSDGEHRGRRAGTARLRSGRRRRRSRRCRAAPASGAAYRPRAGQAPPTLAPDARDRHAAEIGVRGEEALDLRLVLLAQQRAGDIDEPPARPHQPRGAVEDLVLERGAARRGRRASERHLASGLRRQVPVPVQGASTSTRSKLAAWRLTHLSRSRSAACAAPLLAPARRSRSAARSSRRADDVAGDELAAISHGRRQRQGLAAGAGAEIDDAHARPRIDQERRELRALVLHLDEPVAEAVERPDSGTRSNDRKPSGENGVGSA